MSIGCLRALLAAWLAVAISCTVWPLFSGWASWPAEAQTYAQWVIYQIARARLPLAPEASLLGVGCLLLGGLLLFLRVRVGLYLFLAGLVVHAYSKYTTLPTIAASAELGLYAAFYVLSGVVLGSSLATTFTRPSPEGAKEGLHNSVLTRLV